MDQDNSGTLSVNEYYEGLRPMMEKHVGEMGCDGQDEMDAEDFWN